MLTTSQQACILTAFGCQVGDFPISLLSCPLSELAASAEQAAGETKAAMAGVFLARLAREGFNGVGMASRKGVLLRQRFAQILG